MSEKNYQEVEEKKMKAVELDVVVILKLRRK